MNPNKARVSLGVSVGTIAEAAFPQVERCALEGSNKGCQHL